MSEERKKERDFRFSGGTEGAENETRGGTASRARNRTVLLTPETVGQVRASLGVEEESATPDPVSELLPPVNGGWAYPDAGGSVSYEEPAAPAESAPEGDIRPQFEARPRSGYGRPATTTGSFGFRASVPSAPSSASAAPAPAARQTKTPTATDRRPGIQNGFEEDRGYRPVKEQPKSRIVGFLISFDQAEFGEVFEIRAGRWLLTSRPTDHGEFILIEDESISPMHAVVRATNDGKVQILDQLSEHGTGIIRSGTTNEEEVSGATVLVQHGDAIRFGKRRFMVCLVPSTAS